MAHEERPGRDAIDGESHPTENGKRHQENQQALTDDKVAEYAKQETTDQ